MRKQSISRLSSFLLLGLAAALLPTSAFAEGPPSIHTACVMDPKMPNSATTVVISREWKSEYPFSERFGVRDAAVQDESELVIDLDVMKFRTTPLVQVNAVGQRTFLPPDLSTFIPELVRQPFVAGGADLFIVQAASPEAQVRLRAFLEQGGYEIRESIPRFAYLVSLNPAGLAVLMGRPEVFWLGLYQPAFRFSSELDYIIANDPAHELRFTVRLDTAAYSTSEQILGEVSLFGLSVTQVGRDSQAWIARAAGRAVDARLLATLPSVLWVERFADFQLDNDVARASTSVTTGRGALAGPMMDVEDVWARGIRGEGQIASASDTGLDTGNITTVDSMHWDFGRTGNATNPMRVIKGYALGRAGNWNDDQTTGGGHGTHTSGSIVGNGVRSGSSPGVNTFTGSHAGVAPKAQFVFQSIMDSGGALGGLPADLNTLFQSPYNDGARVHSNSWGAAVSGAYNTSSSQTDQFAWNNKDMVITFSAGNSGVDGKRFSGSSCVTTGAPIDGIIDSGSIGSPGTAKNTITVGAAESYRPSVSYEYPSGTCSNPTTWYWFNYCTNSTAPVSTDLMANNANGMAAFSSRGPVADGRIKPDIVAPGTFILSTRTSVNQAFEQWGTCGVAAGETPYYVYMGGTSMSNPLTAGASTLVRQYYVDGWHANNSGVTNGAAVPAQGFNPSSALVKATLINGAWDMSPGQYGTGATKEIPPGWDTGRSLPNNVEGFGRIDLEHSLFPGSGWGDVTGRVLEVHDVSAGLVTGGQNSSTFQVSANTNPLIVTLVWTDPWAASGAGTKLVNNLDLVVTAPDGITKYTPNKVDDTAGTADNLNNVEQVKVTSPAVGTWSIQVKGTNVPGNGNTGTNVQPYALLISGVSGVPCTPPSAPTGVPGSRCGTGTVVLAASGAGAGQDYKWYAASSGGSPLQTGGSSYTTPSISTTTTYYVSIYDTSGCESGRTAVTATVNPLPAKPTITPGGPTTFCAGGSVTLTSSAGSSYLWSTGATTSSISVSTSGSYWVQVTDGNGCTSPQSDPTVVNVVPTVVTLSGQTVTTTQTFTSCGTLTLGPAFRVQSPGNVTARAVTAVMLANGFSAGSGAIFTAGLNP